MILNANERTFAPFSLTRLLTTCFGRGNGEKVCILIDLPNPADMKDFKFLEDETLSIQNYGHEVFYKGFKNGQLDEMNWTGGEIFAYKETGGSNLDMEDDCFDPEGNHTSESALFKSKFGEKTKIKKIKQPKSLKQKLGLGINSFNSEDLITKVKEELLFNKFGI